MAVRAFENELGVPLKCTSVLTPCWQAPTSTWQHLQPQAEPVSFKTRSKTLVPIQACSPCIAGRSSFAISTGIPEPPTWCQIPFSCAKSSKRTAFTAPPPGNKRFDPHDPQAGSCRLVGPRGLHFGRPLRCRKEVEIERAKLHPSLNWGVLPVMTSCRSQQHPERRRL